MIGYLSGVILFKNFSHIVIDVNGVGYEIEIALNTYNQLPALGTDVRLHIHFIVRKDLQILYGFLSLDERSLFRDLIRVNGVGPKMALTILSRMQVDEFVRGIQDKDITTLIKLPGIGKKIAERLIIELRDYIQSCIKNGRYQCFQQVERTSSIVTSLDPSVDAADALVYLGYKSIEANRIVHNILKDNPNSTSEDLIRLSLKRRS